MKRRELLLSLAGGLAASLLKRPSLAAEQSAPPKTSLGIVQYCFSIRQKAERSSAEGHDLGNPAALLEHCRRFGAGGIQTSLGRLDEASAAAMRQQAERCEMFVEGSMDLPRSRADVERFEAELKSAKRAGAEVIRVVMIPGRRYEQFNSAEEFRQSAQRGLKSLELAEPVAARHRMRLAVENHKDHRVGEELAVLEHVGSEYVGLCVDTGNNLALLEDPLETVRALAPWAFTVHLKDQAVRQYDAGFLLADVPMGEGFLQLKKMVEILRKAQPKARFSLETITRDPLRVPCLTEKYWATFADVPGRDLARTLRTVRAHAAEKLPEVGRLPLAEQVKLEEETVKRCLNYAREQLGL